MRILHVLPYSPVPPVFGGALRNYHILKYLAKSHDVTVLAIGTPEEAGSIAREFQLDSNRVRIVPEQWMGRRWRFGQLYAVSTGHSFTHLLVGRYPRMQEAIDELLSENAFDIVQTEFTTLGCYDIKGDHLRILDAHNVEFDNFHRMSLHANSLLRKLYYKRESRHLAEEEAEACRKNDAVFVTSARDRDLFDTLVPQIPKFVIPNGVDTSRFVPSDEPVEAASLVFSGMMAYVPNYDGIMYFLDEIFPLIRRKVPGVKIYVVGNRPPKGLLKRASDQVIVTGFVEDVRPYVAKACVYVVPLRMGSGTRLKILEALAMKKPVVTTSIGCEGLDLSHGRSALIADDPLSFAGQVIELLGNEQLRRTLAGNGYDLVRNKYDWSVVHRRMEEAYQELRIGDLQRRGDGARRESIKIQ